MKEPIRSKEAGPSSGATYERARRLANLAVWTVALQCRRLKTPEPEDGEFLFRRWADFQFLIVALARCRRAAVLAGHIDEIADEMRIALEAFDAALPMLKTMRDTAEHFDDYAMERGRNQDVSRKSLEVGVVGEKIFQWLGYELDADKALVAAQLLFSLIKAAEGGVRARSV
jgi:hypothetical protein